MPYELGALAEETRKQFLEMLPGILLLLRIQRDRGEGREEC